MFLNWKYEDLGVSVTLWISISCVIQGIGPGEFKQTPHAGSAWLSDEWGNFSKVSWWYLLLGEPDVSTAG